MKRLFTVYIRYIFKKNIKKSGFNVITINYLTVILKAEISIKINPVKILIIKDQKFKNINGIKLLRIL